MTPACDVVYVSGEDEAGVEVDQGVGYAGGVSCGIFFGLPESAAEGVV